MAILERVRDILLPALQRIELKLEELGRAVERSAEGVVENSKNIHNLALLHEAQGVHIKVAEKERAAADEKAEGFTVDLAEVRSSIERLAFQLQDVSRELSEMRSSHNSLRDVTSNLQAELGSIKGEMNGIGRAFAVLSHNAPRRRAVRDAKVIGNSVASIEERTDDIGD